MREHHILAPGGYAYAIGDPADDYYWCWCYFGERDVIRTDADSDRLERWDAGPVDEYRKI